MKRLAAVIAALLVLSLAVAAEASGRRGYYGQYGPAPRVSAFWSTPGFTFGFTYPGAWYAPRRAYRPPPRVWVPGHWEKTRVWVPGRYERLERPRERHRHDRHGGYERYGRHDRSDHHGRRHDRHERKRDQWEGRRYGWNRYR